MPYGKRRYTSQTSVIDTAAVYDMNEQKLQSEINQQMHGNGYGTCSTASSTLAKVVTLDGYQLITGGMVTVKFTYAVPANATLNINSQGAKAIYYKESIMGSTAPIDASTIRAGDICTFIYDGTRYVLTNIDRWGLPATTSRSGLMSAADKTKLNTLKSSNVIDDSDVGGSTVKDSLNSLSGSLNSINFANPTVITASGEDLNTYTTGGVWYFTDAAAPTNKPSGAGNYGFFVVMNGGTNSRLLQLWIDSSTSKNNIYFRSNDTSSIAWGAWKRVVRDDELTTTTIQASNIRENANIVIKNSGKTVVVSVSNGDNAIAHQTASTSWQILGYVPSGYRPSAAIFAVCFLRNVSTPTQLVFSYGRVATDGAIQIWNSAREGIVNMALTVIYLLD